MARLAWKQYGHVQNTPKFSRWVCASDESSNSNRCYRLTMVVLQGTEGQLHFTKVRQTWSHVDHYLTYMWQSKTLFGQLNCSWGKCDFRSVQPCLCSCAIHDVVLQASTIGQGTSAQITSQRWPKILLTNVLFDIIRSILDWGDDWFSTELLTSPSLHFVAQNPVCYFL